MMDTRAVEKKWTSGDAEIIIDNLVAALAGLNSKILRLRDEIVAFKNKNKTPLSGRDSSKEKLKLLSTPSELNDPTKNDKKRTGARCERNFQGDESVPPGSIDLSARSSFAKRAREVKAPNESAVFKEDYLRGDKSIEDDERPNRSRVSEPSETHRRSISRAEKSGKEIGRGSRNVRDLKTLRAAALNKRSEKIKENAIVNDIVSWKIKKKKISRGVQYDTSMGRRSRARRFFLSCFVGSRDSSTQKVKNNKISTNRSFDINSQNEENKSVVDTETMNNSNNAETKKITSDNTEQKDRNVASYPRENVAYVSKVKNVAYVSKVKNRLDTCIAQLNGIIGDACVIFGKSAAKRNS